MTAWLMPGVAAAFWGGLLLWSALAGSGAHPTGAGVALTLGTAALVAACRIAPAHGVVASRARASGAGALLVVGVAALGLGWGGVAASRLHGSLLSRLGPVQIEALGTLREDPAKGVFGWYAEADLTQVTSSTGTEQVRESAWLQGSGRAPSAVRGDRVALEGTIRYPTDVFADALHHKGIAAEIQLVRFEKAGPASNPFLRATQVFRDFVGRSIDRLFAPSQAGLLLGLALGDASQMDPGVARDFQATGLGHLLVVSGENVAMVLAPMLALATMARLGRRGRFVVGVGTIAFFVVLTGAEPTVMRAGTMATLTLLGVLMGRPRSTGAILAAAVLLQLVLEPWLVWSIGFQLSVGATAGIVALAGPIGGRLARHAPRPLALAAGTTMAAQAGVAPLLLFHFNQIPGVTLLANLAAFPAVAPALVIGLVAAAAGLASVTVGRFLAWIASMPLGYLEWVANRLARAPVGHITSRGGPAPLVVGGGLVVGLAWWVRSGAQIPRRLTRPLVVALGVAVPLLVWASALGAGTPPGFTLRFFDVGQGDAALVTTPEGADVLVDGGPDPQTVATDLAALGVKRLDVVVATHPHADHIIGLPAVLAEVPVGLMLEPGCPDTSAIQTDLDASAARDHVAVRHPRAGDEFAVGDLRLDVLSPDRCWVGTNSDPNNDSLVILMSYHGDTALFGAEPEQPAQQDLLDGGTPIQAEVLKVPHHGAATSLPAFFQAVHAQVAVVSVGPNDYGHPVPSTLGAIEAAGSRVWRTDEHGDIVVTFDGRGPVVHSDR
jgi:competence protein ComEC